MDKQEYYQESFHLGLPKRCPLINRCSRRMHTIGMMSELDTEDTRETIFDSGTGISGTDKEMIPIHGEGIEQIRGENDLFIRGACPEVFLHDPEHSPFSAPVEALSMIKIQSGQVVLKEERHYSECAEFCHYQWQKK